MSQGSKEDIKIPEILREKKANEENRKLLSKQRKMPSSSYKVLIMSLKISQWPLTFNEYVTSFTIIREEKSQSNL